MFSRPSWTLVILSVLGVCHLTAQDAATVRAKARAGAEKDFKSKLLLDKIDPFTHERLRATQTDGIFWGPGECGSRRMSYLTLATKRVDKESTSVFLLLKYHADNWLFLSDTARLQVLADTTLLGFPALGKARQETASDASVTETQAFAATRRQLGMMADADDVLVRLVGRDRACEGRVIPYALAVLWMFVGQVLADMQ